jgi:curli biogenesis system outer membrane secretion channel CsgG
MLNTHFTKSWVAIAIALAAFASPSPSFAQSDNSADGADAAEVQLIEYPIAILPFRERGKEVENMGGQVADLVFAKLVVDPGLFLVEREDLDKLLSEAELNLSGIVNPKDAIAIGQLTGARLIVTGSVFQVENKVYRVAKIIGTETSRVVGASVNEVAGSGLDAISNRLGHEIIRSIRKSSDSLVAKPVKKSDRIAALNAQLSDAKRPTVFISVEERHVGLPTIDPAAETELMLFCKETGFDVIDPDQGSSQQAKYLIQGEGMSEFAGRRGNLASVKARLEVKVVDRATGQVVAADRQTRVAVDLVEQIAGKQALQEAAADIAERLLPKLVSAKDAQK